MADIDEHRQIIRLCTKGKALTHAPRYNKIENTCEAK